MSVASASSCKSFGPYYLTSEFLLLTIICLAFYFGYDVRRFAHNIIALSSNTKQSISDFYNNWDSWRPSGEYSYTGTIDGRPDLSVTIITTSLDGDRSYNLEVHIGIAQSK